MEVALSLTGLDGSLLVGLFPAAVTARLQLGVLRRCRCASESCGGQKSEVSLLGLKSRCWQGWFPPGSFRLLERIHFLDFCSFWRLPALLGP